MSPVAQLFQALHDDERGVVMTEYLQVLVLVTLAVALAMVPLGGYLLGYYDNIEFLMGFPFP